MTEEYSIMYEPAKCRGVRSGQRRERSPRGNVCFHGAQLRETEHILNIYVSELVRQEHVNSILHEEQMSRARKTDEA